MKKWGQRQLDTFCHRDILTRMGRNTISAIILSAGTSSRMEDLKPLMRLGEITVVEQVIHTFAASGIGDILVVVD